MSSNVILKVKNISKDFGLTHAIPVVAENGENKGEIPPNSDSLYGSCKQPYDNGL